jgi:hypothetical protein
MKPRARQVAPGWLEPYTIWYQRLEVANDVFSDVEYLLSYRPATSHTVSSMSPCCPVIWYCSCARRGVNRGGAAL